MQEREWDDPLPKANQGGRTMTKRIDDRDLVDISGAGDSVVPAPKGSGGTNLPSSGVPGSGGGHDQDFDTPDGDDGDSNYMGKK
jgi:hypothetical protein